MTGLIDGLSDKQIEAYQGSTSRINIFEGAVRAGKTFASLLRWIDYCVHGPKGALVACGKNQDTIKRNFVVPMQELIGSSIQYFPGKKEMIFYDRIIYLVGANDERATGKIQGSTFAGAWVDEASLIPESFFKMLLSRLSIPGAKLFATTNPDSPYHWLKTDYIDKEEELNCKVFSFRLDDNPSLTEEFKNDLKAEYQGLWYKRYILGEWVLAEGTIYDFFDESLHVKALAPTYAKEYFLAIDYGTYNPFVALLIGYNDESHPAYWIEKEYYYDSRKEGRQKTDSEYFQELQRLFYQYYPISLAFCDPSAASFIVECKRQGVRIVQANNDVLPGIRTTANLLMNGDLIVLEDCENTIKEFGSYVWDDKSVKLGEDKPLKMSDHCMDALRYMCETRHGTGKKVNKQYQIETVNHLANLGHGWKPFHGSAFQ